MGSHAIMNRKHKHAADVDAAETICGMLFHLSDVFPHSTEQKMKVFEFSVYRGILRHPMKTQDRIICDLLHFDDMPFEHFAQFRTLT